MSTNEAQRAPSAHTTTPLPDTGSMYDWIGGEPTVRKLVDRFYEIMDGEDFAATIRGMHQADLAPMRASLFEYLSGWLGGPPLYVAKHGSPCISRAHAPFAIDRAASDAWMRCMNQAMLDTGIPEQYRALLSPAFERMATMLINRP